MKTMRKKWLLPIAVFAIAIASAFASNTTTAEAVPVLGYIDNPLPCHISVQCSTTGTIACKSGAQTAFRMNGSGTRCDLPAFKL
ncbi:hypothetical protein LS48_01965 [Aequorivita aquimaris]|uniref:DUF2282 domain-containing protein n=1 Tax=Aequorivita aquimaris TaxID=1548749 RepID=A0A137RM33_9FLAO|nr:DUF6520 family protein [Aequorivita aquimaris]KXO01253.1 hypothetical protein LS48_01965 [Aequorivita aquimaris]